jgi:hypothetical protein
VTEANFSSTGRASSPQNTSSAASNGSPASIRTPGSTFPTVWIYENRENMVRFWNHLIDNGLIDLDGDRLRRSRKGVPNYSSHDVVWTIPGVGGDLVDAFKLFKDNHITFRS